MDWPELISLVRRLAVAECRKKGRPVPRLSDRRVRRVLERHLQGCDDPQAVALLEGFDPSEHPRGQPGNAGEFGPGGGGKGKKDKAATDQDTGEPRKEPSGPAGLNKAAAAAGIKKPRAEPGNSQAGNGVPARKPRAKKERPPAPELSDVAKTAAGSTRARVGNENEERFAAGQGKDHRRLPDSEAMDVLGIDADGMEHGYELKTLLTSQSGQIHMTPKQAARKDAWARGELVGIKSGTPRPDPSFDPKKGRRVHVVVIDHREAYFDAVEGTADFTARKMDQVYYARHPRPYNVKDMVRCDDMESLKVLSLLPEEQYRQVYDRFKGKSWPSGKPHPEVTKIVTGDTPAQLRAKHADDVRKLGVARDRLARKKARERVLRQRRDKLRRRAERIKKTGDREAGRRAQRLADRANATLAPAAVDTFTAQRTVDLRKKKLRLSAGALKAAGQEVPK